MGRSPSYDENGLKKGPWTSEEDEKLVDYITKNGLECWRTLPKKAGLNRCGKSCRLRWTNYLRPDIKRGKFSEQEQSLIIKLHSLLGNKWSRIATHLPGRTDNEIKNYWNTFVRKKLLKMGIDPTTHKPTTDDLNNLLNLSQLLTTPTQFSNPIMSPWDTTAQLVGLQNLLQVINTNPLLPYYMKNNTTTTTTQLGSQTLNPFEGLANYNNATNNNSPQIIPNYSWPYSNLEGVCANNNNNTIKSISGSYDHINLLENPISLPQLVSESLETSTTNQMVNSNSDAAYLSTINVSPEYSTTFGDLEKLMDDDTIYWKDIF